MKQIQRWIATAVCSLLLATGCGGGDGGTPASGDQSWDGNGAGTGNRAPRIDGVPASTVRPQQSYSFQPVATDPDGDALTFTAENLPGWLTLNPRTGRLSGTPTEADIGTYHRIVVSVSDGRASTSLPPFSITVTDAAVGSATLSWMPPDRNTDGSVLTDLAGYEIWYGQDRDVLDQKISLMNPSLSVYVVENLSSGTWYFAVAAVNSRGIAGGLSEVVSKTIS